MRRGGSAQLTLPGVPARSTGHRDAVLAAVVRIEPATAAEVAAALGIRTTTARHHLERLTADGDARRDLLRVPGVGRVLRYSTAAPTPAAPASGVRLRALPATVADCPEGPCPWYRCRHHMGLARVTREGVTVEDGWEPDDGDGPWEPPGETCSLRAAEAGGMAAESVARVLGVTREAVRRVEAEALGRAERRMKGFV